MQALSSDLTTWHITFGTYGTRLHGGAAPTVEKKNNQVGQTFVAPDKFKEQANRQRMNFPPIRLTPNQRITVEQLLPQMCQRGNWPCRVCAAQSDHVHLLCDIPPETHGGKVRRLIKRWLGQQLSERWPLEEGARWWAIEGSNKAIHDASYLNNAYNYIQRQRITDP